MIVAEYGLIEAGGTKFVAGISDGAGQIRARAQFPTTTPEETIGACIGWFREAGLAPAAMGVASFGPLDLNRASPTWGRVTRTPKPFWSGADLVGPLSRAFGCPVGLETDVNGAALAEARWGAGKAVGSLLYVTIGTGVGGGFVSDGRLLHGVSHPEMGHMRMPRHADDTGPDDAGFAGHCPFHGDCLEGLAAGPAIIARWGASLSDLPDGHPGADMIAWYLGQACVTFQAIMEPARIVLGGGVMGTPGLIDKVRAVAGEAGAGYFVGDPREVIVPPALGSNSGLLGALAVALGL
jgi:fructokinase